MESLVFLVTAAPVFPATAALVVLAAPVVALAHPGSPARALAAFQARGVSQVSAVSQALVEDPVFQDNLVFPALVEDPVFQGRVFPALVEDQAFRDRVFLALVVFPAAVAFLVLTEHQAFLVLAEHLVFPVLAEHRVFLDFQDPVFPVLAEHQVFPGFQDFQDLVSQDLAGDLV